MRRRFADFLARLRKGVTDLDQARLAAILDLNRALARAGDRRAVLNRLLDEAVTLFGAERGFVLSTGGAVPGFSVAAARSMDREPVRNPERKVSSTVVRRALERGEGVFSEDAQEDDLAAAASVADIQLRSVLCMPLQVGERTLGCLYLDHRFQKEAFSPADLPWLQAFAHQGALVLHLHELLEQNRERAERATERSRRLEQDLAAQAQELAALQETPDRSGLPSEFDGIVGESPALLRVLHLLHRVAASDFPVLLTGDSGTGKELAARALHAAGPRGDGPFVPVNVAAIPEGLLESELFGHVRGAFTGAERDRQGLLVQAHGGVLFLDEVTEMDPEVQVKLLRFLEDPQVRPVGGDRTRTVDLRVIAATNRDPLRAVAEGRLREDLYYRLAVVTVRLPSLRERAGDLPLLVSHFLELLADKEGRPPRAMGKGLLEAMTRRPWPGNLRQLFNEVQRLDALAGDGPIGPELLGPPAVPCSGEPPDTLSLQDLEAWAIARALEQSGGNKAEAARLLGISRRTLYARLEKGRDTPPSG